MRCQTVQRMLLDYVHDDLVECEYDEITDHLRDCSACREHRNDLLLAQQRLEGMRAEPDPEDDTLRLTAVYWTALNETERRRRRWRAMAAATAMVATAACIVLVMKPRIDVSASHFSVSWGAPRSPQVEHSRLAEKGGTTELSVPNSIADHEQRLRELDTLSQLLVLELDGQEREIAEMGQTLVRWIETSQRRDAEKWTTVRRGMHQLHLADLENLQSP